MKKGRKYFTNDFITEGDITKILLPDNTFAIIDTDQLKFVKDYSWYYYENKYHKLGVISMKGRQCIRLHNLIAPYKKVEHINGDKKDCRKANMRNYSHPQLRVNHGNNKGKSRFLKVRERERYFEIVKRFRDDNKRELSIRFLFFFKPRGKISCKYQTKEDAFNAAQEKLIEIKNWSREEILNEYEQRKNKHAKLFDMISDWSVWENSDLMNKSEFYKHINTGESFDEVFQGYRLSR